MATGNEKEDKSAEKLQHNYNAIGKSLLSDIALLEEADSVIKKILTEMQDKENFTWTRETDETIRQMRKLTSEVSVAVKEKMIQLKRLETADLWRNNGSKHTLYEEKPTNRRTPENK